MWLFEVGLPSLTMPSTANSPSCCCGLVQPQLRNATDRRVFVSCDGWRGQAGPVLRPACEPTQAPKSMPRTWWSLARRCLGPHPSEKQTIPQPSGSRCHRVGVLRIGILSGGLAAEDQRMDVWSACMRLQFKKRSRGTCAFVACCER